MKEQLKRLSTPIRTYPLDDTTTPKGSESVAMRGDLLLALATLAGPLGTGQHETGRRANQGHAFILPSVGSTLLLSVAPSLAGRATSLTPALYRHVAS